MPKVNAPLLAFNRGIVSKKALGRTDVERLAWSAEQQSNWRASSLGSMMLRPGLGYLIEAGETKPRYLPFVFRVDDTALAEFTDGQVRIVVDDEALAFAAVTAAVANGDMEPDIASWTDADDSGATSAYAASMGNAAALYPHEVYDYATGATATAYYKLDADGIVYTKRLNVDAGVYQAQTGEWKLSGAAADYEHRVTVLSGTLTSGTTGTWLGGGTDREFYKSQTSVGTGTVVLLVETRLTGTTTTIASVQITLKANYIAEGGGGFEGGGSGFCVTAEMWLNEGLQAKDAKVGDSITVVEVDGSIRPGAIEAISAATVPCLLLTSESGAQLECSDSTPFTLRDGSQAMSSDILGREVLAERLGSFSWERVTSVEMIGHREVRVITVGNRSYAAGLDAGARIVSHNKTQQVP